MKRNLSRFLLTVLTPLLLIGLTSCQSQLTDVAEDAQFYKGGKGKPPPVAPVVLEEYWVFPNPNVTDGNLIHAAGTGAVYQVVTAVAFDYFFNGTRDLPQHFEYAYGAVGPTAITSDGTWHVDIPWKGERDVIGPYPDMLLTDGPDPFVLGLYIFANEGTGITRWPEGVLYDGVLLGPEGDVYSEQHYDNAQQSVTSYALFEGEQAEFVLYLEEVSISSATCTVVSTGRGKKSVRQQVRRVSVDYTIEFGAMESDSEISSPIPSDQFAWVGLHLRDGDSGDLSERLSVRPSQPRVSGSFTRDLPDGEHNFMLEFLVDYVNPTGPFANYAYDPGQNDVTTTVGFGDTPWSNGASKTVNDGNFPVGKTELFPVTCN